MSIIYTIIPTLPGKILSFFIPSILYQWFSEVCADNLFILIIKFHNFRLIQDYLGVTMS
jgi:hypothetical protein